MVSVDASARHDLTDAQWELLEPLLPAPPVRGRPRRSGLRAMIDAVRWRTRVGAPSLLNLLCKSLLLEGLHDDISSK